MRRFPALLVAAGLAAAPASAVARPSNSTQVVERTEWSTGQGRLGVMVMSLTPELRTHYGAPADRGVLVARVDPKTPAALAGVQVGDVLVEVRGRQIAGATDVLAAVDDLGKGAQVKLVVVRGAATRTLDATLTSDALSLPSLPWLRSWLTEPAEVTSSSWLRELRELFQPRPAGPMCRSPRETQS